MQTAISGAYINAKQEAQLMLTNPRDAFSGQSRSPNMVPFYGVDGNLADSVAISRSRKPSLRGNDITGFPHGWKNHAGFPRQ